MIISDPWFYVTAIPAVLIFGIGKGGLGGALGVVAVPLMSLSVSSTQAAAILLPILCVMDGFAVKQHYRHVDTMLLRKMLPGAVLGVAIAGMVMSYSSENWLKIVVGSLCLLFCGHYFFTLFVMGKKKLNPTSKYDRLLAFFWSGLSGFSSTTIHAGGGPASIYLLPLKLDKVTLIATMAVFFSVVNVFKLFPFYLLGQFDSSNLMTALILIPLAPIGVKLGVGILYRV
ncbi:sulfite exporter TauE/SafE family protein, partial [Vibrio anguillarum]